MPRTKTKSKSKTPQIMPDQYVIKCIKETGADGYGFGSKFWPGDFVNPQNMPTADINESFIYRGADVFCSIPQDFPDFFVYIPVDVIITPRKNSRRKNSPEIPNVEVDIGNYRYGRVTKTLKNAVEWINAHPSQINNHELNMCLPKAIYNKLSTDEYDFLESETYERRNFLWVHFNGVFSG